MFHLGIKIQVNRQPHIHSFWNLTSYHGVPFNYKNSINLLDLLYKIVETFSFKTVSCHISPQILKCGSNRFLALGTNASHGPRGVHKLCESLLPILRIVMSSHFAKPILGSGINSCRATKGRIRSFVITKIMFTGYSPVR